MKKASVRTLTQGASIAALYALLAWLSSLLGIGYGAIQCRLSEALCLLPLVLPSSVWGLTVGCLIANLLSPFGLPDIIFGTLASFFAACLTAICKNAFLGGLAPVFCNALFVGALLSVEEAGFTVAFFPLFGYHAFTIALGEALSVYLLGLPLLHMYRKKLSED